MCRGNLFGKIKSIMCFKRLYIYFRKKGLKPNKYLNILWNLKNFISTTLFSTFAFEFFNSLDLDEWCVNYTAVKLKHKFLMDKSAKLSYYSTGYVIEFKPVIQANSRERSQTILYNIE